MSHEQAVTDAFSDARGLQRFVPGFARRRAACGRVLAAELDDSLAGALFVADIAGFSALTERMARSGQVGIEEMQTILNGCFERIVSIIDEGGGEVYKFAGDATIAWWPSGPDGLHGAALAATATALRLQALVPELSTSLRVPLSLRIGIGAGSLYTAIAGGVNGRWEALLGGDALQQVAGLQAVPSGQVALSAPAWQLLRDDCTGEPVGAGGFIVHGATPPLPLPPAGPQARPDKAQLAPLVPRHLLQRLEANQHDALAELRSASVLFAVTKQPRDLPALQRATLAMQQAVYGVGGSVLQCLLDDKADFVLVAAWGIPGSSYPDDAERAMRAAHMLVTQMAAHAAPVSVGVASGRLFAGLRGSQSRAEYALIGAVVNLAARMAQAPGGARVYCDDATAQAVPAIGYVPRPDVALKGLPGVKVFESLGKRRADETSTGELIGREAEYAQLLALLQQAQDNPTRSAVVLVEGEAGIGKSHLCHAFVDAAVKQGLLVATGASDPLDNSAAYRPLRRVFDTLLGLQGVTSRTVRRERVLFLLGKDDATRDRASLLTDVLDLDLLPTLTEQQMSGRARIDATADLLAQLLLATHAGALRVLLLEDLHWLDSASWSVLDAAVRRCPSLLLVLSSRPLGDDSVCSAPLQDLGATRVRLLPLGENAVRAIIASELGASTVPEPVLRAVADKTQGLPLFVRQVVASLVYGLVVRCAQGVVTFDARALAGFAIPDTIQGVVISRIDGLTPRQQLTLKSASVVGRVFTFDALTSAAAGQSSTDALRADVDVLVARGLVQRESDAAQFHFSHALVRDAVYSLLPLGFRREMHASLGAWYERQAGENPLMLGRIAAHWEQAQDPVRAVRALEQAGNHALRTGAYREAQTLFGRLLDIAANGFGEGAPGPVDASNAQKARWLLHLGLASYDLGELERARSALESSAVLLGQSIPGDNRIGAALVLEAVRATLRHFWRRRSPAKLAQAAPARQIAAVLSALGRIYHLTQRPRHTMYSMVRRFNLLHQHAASPEQMGAFSGMMYLTTMLGRRQLADRYAARVTELHRRLQNPLAYADASLTVALAYLGQARWDACERCATDAEQIFQRLGERQPRMTMVSMLANAAELQGAFDHSAQLWALEQQLADEVGDQLGQCWAAGGKAMLAIRRGNFNEAVTHARQAQALARATGEAVSYLADSGLLALALFELGDFGAARALLDEGLAIMSTLPRLATAHHLLNGLDTFSELVLRFWEREAPPSGSAAWKQWSQHAAMATTRTSGYARMFDIGAPMAAQRLALQHWLHGRRAKALTAWQHAIAEGERTAIPYETAKAHLELARHLPAGDPQAQAHATQAMAIFGRLGAHAGLQQARAVAGA